MTKRFFTIIILATSLVACKKSTLDNRIVNGLPASAATGSNNKLKEVTIVTYASKSGNTELFTWSASGAITDNGNWTDDKVIWGAVQSPMVGTLHDTFTLNGNKGSIKLSFDGLLKPTDDPDLFIIEGNWHILSGTGSYNGIVGQGEGTVMINFSQTTATSTLEGQTKY